MSLNKTATASVKGNASRIYFCGMSKIEAINRMRKNIDINSN